MPWNRTTLYTITLSSTLVGNTQIKLMLHEYNLQYYSCDLIYIVALNVFTSFDNQSHNTPIKMYTILTNRAQSYSLTLDANGMKKRI